MKFDYHNGKGVVNVQNNEIQLEDGTTISNILSVAPSEIVGTKLLKVIENTDGVSYLHFGHSYEDGREPTVVAIVEATEGDPEATNA